MENKNTGRRLEVWSERTRPIHTKDIYDATFEASAVATEHNCKVDIYLTEYNKSTGEHLKDICKIAMIRGAKLQEDGKIK